jgi:tellurite resistance protein TehA-like permease
LILTIWRYLWKGYPVTYEPRSWAMIFPLGMYPACTLELIKAMDLDLLSWIPRFFIYIALLAWLVTFVAMVRELTRKSVAPTGVFAGSPARTNAAPKKNI